MKRSGWVGGGTATKKVERKSRSNSSKLSDMSIEFQAEEMKEREETPR